MSQQQNDFYYYKDQLSFCNNSFNGSSNSNSFSPSLNSPAAAADLSSNGGHLQSWQHYHSRHNSNRPADRVESGRKSVPLQLYASSYNQSAVLSEKGFDNNRANQRQHSVAAAANTFRRQSVENCPLSSSSPTVPFTLPTKPYERAERHREAADNGIEQQQTKQQQMFLADQFNHRWFSQQQIGKRRSNDDVGVVRRCQTEQLSFGEEDAPVGSFWASPTQRTTTPRGTANGEGVHRLLEKKRTGGSSAGNEIASRFYRHSAGAYRFDQQAPKGGRKAMEEFDYSWGRDSGGMEDQWQPKNSVSRGNAIAAYCRSGTPLCHLNATQNRSTTSRPGGLAEASSRPERGGSEGPSIKGLATEGQVRRRSSLGRVEQQYTRARAVNNGDFELAKLLQNYAPIDGGDNAVVKQRLRGGHNYRPSINRSKTLPIIKYHPAEGQQNSQLNKNIFQNFNKHLDDNKNDLCWTANSHNIEHFFPEEKSSDFLVGEKTLHGERELQDELEKLFEQLGLLEQPQLMANGDWKGLFASMQKRFGSLEEETQKRQNQEDLRKSFCFATNGAQKAERKQNVCTKPRRDILLGRCASSNSLAGRGFEPTKSSHLLSNGGERRRPSLHQQQQQQKCGGDLGNFWLTMVKARAETSSQRQKLSLGLSAAEKLQSICQPADGQQQKQKADESNHPISNYPYRKYGGVIETVAMRRNNYLMEAARTSSPSGTSTPTTNSGRATPNLRAFKSPSPSIVDQPNADFLDFGTPSAKDLNREKENRKGCGRFPTANEEEKGKSMESSADRHVTVGLSTNRLGILENGHVKTKARLRKSLSPDNISDCSQHSQTSAKPTTLPQPIPKHNLRDKLINAGFPVSRQSTSFFGGNANNPFYGQKQTVHRHQQQQHQQQPQHQQQQHQQNSSPNFPLTNTVISRVSLFEKQQQNSPDSASVLQSSHHLQHSSEAKRQHLDIVNGPSGNGQLSPRSSVFRTKSVIVFDFDHVEKGTPAKVLCKEGHKSKNGMIKEQKQWNNDKATTPNWAPKTATTKKEEVMDKKTKKPESSAENNSGTNASGDKSPRWCADPNDAVKKGNRLQWERPKKSGSASSIMVQHQHLINGLITPMVVNSTKVPQAQFITASVSSIVSGAIKLPEKFLGKDAAEETELPTRKEPEGSAEMDIRVAGKLAASPRFHFSAGRPVSREENERVLLRIRELFESRPRAQLLLDDFDELCRRMDFAVYSKRAVFDACCCSNGLPVLPILASTLGDVAEGAEKAEGVARGVPIDFNQFCVYWNRMISEAHDEASRFVFTLSAVRHSHQSLTPPQQRHILSEDFVPMMMDLILTHPGLHFLKEAPQFYSRYADVVIVRIFWNVNRSWTGKISANELRRSNFLQTFRMLDEVQDINKVTDFFSYEHFYVTYCKFWELDTDHDMIISRDDMRRHCNGALTDRIIDRIFSAAVIRTPPEQRTVPQPMGPIRQQPIEAIGFEDFVCFLLAEEDKRHPTSIEYWFRCIDLDGDGQISLYEMEYFYEAIEQKLLAKGMETLALRDVICNLLDSIFPENGHFVTRMDLKRSGLSHRFFNTFVNWIKYVDQESSDGDRASVKTNEDKELSDWEMFCLSEYELLMSETEQTSNEGDVDENIDVILDDEEEEGERVPIADDKRPRVDENGPVGENVFSTTLQRQQTAKALM